MRIPSGVTDQYIYFVAVDSTDYATRETGLSSFTVYRSRNGAAAAAMTTPTVNETDVTNMPGVYELLLDEDMTIDAGDDSQEMVFHITATGMAPVTRTIELYRRTFTAGATLALADINTEVDTAMVTYGLDHLVSASVTGTDVTDNSIVAKLVSASATADWDDFVNTTDALQALRDRGDAAWTTGAGGTPPQLLQSTTIATLSTQTSFTLTAGSADDDAYNGAIVVVTDSATATQKCVGTVSDYTGSTKTVTLSADPAVFTMATGDTIEVIAALGSAGSAPTASQVADAVLDEALSGHTTAGTLGKAIADIETDTNELQTNQGNWLTATGFATSGALATVDANVDAILLDTAEIGAAGVGLSAVPWNASWDAEVQSEVADALTAYSAAAVSDIPTATENADALLNRDMSAVSDTNARSPLNALRFLRNKWSVSGTTLTVTKEDDSTSGWTATLTADAAADPVTGSDPA